ncbi:hypothetical protein N9L12_06230, partial [Luminiphilus sp.]|nr:hypothetical protein [Luminiphilus sp.]
MSQLATNLSATVSKAPQNSYLGLFTVESWREFKRHGGEIMGFNEKKVKIAARLNPGDRILCYLTKVSAFVGVLEVTGPSYSDFAPIWSDGVFPVRLPVRIALEVPLSSAVPIRSLAGQLSFFPSLDIGARWTIHVRTSPRLWKPDDASVVTAALTATVSQLEQKSAAEGAPETPKVAQKKKSKQARFKTDTRVGRIVDKSIPLLDLTSADVLGSYDTALSFNKVTGYSVNVPISATCKPSAVCLKTCYFAIGAPSWSNGLRHQAKVYRSMKQDPVAFAERVALEYDSKQLSFLRWNGGGDLFGESVDVINHLGRIRPDIVLWVVTRIPEYAVQIEEAENVYIHFSLDKDSLPRKTKFLRSKPSSERFFFSYQAEPDEVPP